ncbi:WhiB family transcriptional regulator [Streptomyces cyaneofuscatus]|uniref:WhiB family transcriptional regulator n=1 Tax=Streptomyces cyaneofuscatus TaxID=66883 RepID=UPI00332D3855
MLIRHFATTSHAAPDILTPAENWKTAAACRGAIDDDLWFPDPSDKATTRDAITACLLCPVRLLCREAAADEERGLGKVSRWGIRGGLTPAQRHAADTSTRASHGKGGRQLAPCGTPAAYDRHVRHGEPVDDACRRAHNDHRNAQRKANRAARTTERSAA